MGRIDKTLECGNQFYSVTNSARCDSKSNESFTLSHVLRTKNFDELQFMMKNGLSISEANFYEIGKTFPFAIPEVSKMYPSIAKACIATLYESEHSRDFAEFFQILQSDAPDVTSVREDGLTLLQKACYAENVALAQAIFEFVVHYVPSRALLSEAHVQESDVQGLNSLDALMNTPCAYDTQKKAIHFAIMSLNRDLVELFLRYSPSIDQVDAFGSSCFHYAVGMQCHEILQKLLEKAPSSPLLDAAGGRGNLCMNPLSWAVRMGDEQAVRLLLEFGAKPNLINTNDRRAFDHASALHMAAWYNQLNIVRLLIDNGADPQLRNGDGNTFLHAAAYQGHDLVIQWALEKGYDINITNYDGCTPLFFAVESRRFKTIKFLIENGARTDVVDNIGNTLLHSAVVNTCIFANDYHFPGDGVDVHTKEKDIIDLSLIRWMQAYNNINCMNYDGETPLQQCLRICASDMHPVVFSYLLANGAHPALVSAKELPSLISLMTDVHWKQYWQLIREKSVATLAACASHLDEAVNESELYVRKIFLNKFLKQFDKVLAFQAREGVTVSRPALCGHVRQLKTVGEFQSLYEELVRWGAVMARVELLVKSRLLHFSREMQQRVQDSKFIYTSLKSGVGVIISKNKALEGDLIDDKNTFIVVEDEAGIQGVASFNMDADLHVCYLIHPRNLGIKVSKRAVSNTALILLQEIARRVY